MTVLKGSPNIVRLLDAIPDPHQLSTEAQLKQMPEKAAAVQEFFEGKSLGSSSLDEGKKVDLDFIGNFTNNEVRNYMYKLLEALDSAHSKGIMHLDAQI